jgi:hypothetical protein
MILQGSREIHELNTKTVNKKPTITQGIGRSGLQHSYGAKKNLRRESPRASEVTNKSKKFAIWGRSPA